MVNAGVIIAGVLLLIMFLQVLVLRSRYHRFTIKDYVLRFRNGKLISKGYGGGYFMLPLIDQLVVIPATVQTTIVKPRSRTTVTIMWRIADPEQVFRHYGGSDNEASEDIVDLVEHLLQIEVTNLLRQLQRRDDLSAVEDRSKQYLDHLLESQGIQITTVGIEL